MYLFRVFVTPLKNKDTERRFVKNMLFQSVTVKTAVRRDILESKITVYPDCSRGATTGIHKCRKEEGLATKKGHFVVTQINKSLCSKVRQVKLDIPYVPANSELLRLSASNRFAEEYSSESYSF